MRGMTDGEVLYLIGVIVAFVAFTLMLGYSSMTSPGPKR
jgi:hypothetical protein